MRLLLFGPPTLEGLGKPPERLPWNRPTALLALIGCHPLGIGRDALAALLRPDADEATSRGYLRRQLHRARALAPGWAPEERQVRWTAGCDVADFLAALAEGRWHDAVALQTAPLLAGTGVLGDAALDDWFDAERERLALGLRRALLALLDGEHDDGDDTRRAAWLSRLVALDPLDPTLIGAALRLARGAPSQAVALAAQAALARAAGDCGAGDNPYPAPVRFLPARTPGPARTLDPAVGRSGAATPLAWVGTAAPLLGRSALVGDLARRLCGGPARLLTLLGIGGVGKTRVAVAVADAWRHAMPDSSVVTLAAGALQPGDDLAAAALDAAGIPAVNPDPAAQWQAWLAMQAPAPVLLLADNLEHLVAQPALARALAGWLDAHPGLRILATSRVPLGLAAEHRVELAGLSGDDDGPALLRHHAARLGAVIDDAGAPWLRRISEHLQGHPLGLELAASWLPLMGPREIAAELDRGLAFLADEDVPQPGQRSLRVVFQTSWRLLGAAQREHLAALAVFPDAFDAGDARAVTGATHADLLALAGASWLQREAGGGFVLHPLVRQFAAGELGSERRAALTQVLAEHVAAGVQGLDRIGMGCQDPDQLRWLTRRTRAIHTAWQVALAGRRFDLVAVLARRLGEFMTRSARAATMAALWAQAIEAADGAGPSQAPLARELRLARAGALAMATRHDEAAALLAELEPQLDSAAERSHAATLASVLAWRRGDPEAVARHTQQAIDEARAANEPLLEARAWRNAAAAAQARGAHAAAEACGARALVLAEAHGANLYVAQAQRLLSALHHDAGRLDSALSLLDASIAGFDAADERFERALNLTDRSWVLRQLGRHTEQQAAAAEAFTIQAGLGTTAELAAARLARGVAAADLGALDAAADDLAQAVREALRAGHRPVLRRTVVHLAMLRLRCDRAADGEAAARLAEATRLEGLRPELRDEAQALLARCGGMPADAAGSAASAPDLALLAGQLLSA